MRAERARSLAALWLALLMVMGARTARADETALERAHIQARGWSPWPRQLGKGHYPIFIELTNSGEREQEVELRASCNDWVMQRDVSRRVVVAAGETVALELIAPLSPKGWNDYQVEVRADGERGWLNDVGAGECDARYRAVLVIAAQAPPPGRVEQWVASASTVAVNAGARRMSPGTTPTPNDDIQFNAATFGELPSHHAAYSSLDLAVIDTRDGLPDRAALEPLLAWVRLGGDLALFGPSAGELAAEAPELAAWLEPRFLARDDYSREYLCGLGRIFVEPSEDFLEAASQRDLVRTIVAQGSGTVPMDSGSRIPEATLMIPGLGEIPHRVFALLLIAFAVVIGPVNFIAVQRRNKPVLLLVTIPAIALCASLVLLTYGVFFQGLDVKTASRTIALLDERTHRSACVEQRLMFAGLSPAAGLRPGPGAAVHALPRARQVIRYGTPNEEIDRIHLFVTEGQGRTLSGDYLPSRRAVTQVIRCEQAARARVNVSREGDAYAIENALGAGIVELVLRDAQGRFHRTTGALEPGASAELAPLDDAEGLNAARALLGVPMELIASAHAAVLPQACYAVRLSSGAFRDDCGIETTELASDHRLLGVLPLDHEAWR